MSYASEEEQRETCKELIEYRGACEHVGCLLCPGSKDNHESGEICSRSGWATPGSNVKEPDPVVLLNATKWLKAHPKRPKSKRDGFFYSQEHVDGLNKKIKNLKATIAELRKNADCQELHFTLRVSPKKDGGA